MIALSKRILGISIFLIYCANAIADHIQLTSPDANSVWTAGTEQTITWNLIGDTKADDKDDEKKKNEKDDAKNLMVDVEILRASDGFVLGGDPVVQSVAKGTPASTQKITFQLSDSLKGVYYVKIFRPKSNIFDLKSQHTSQSAKFQILGKDARTPAATTSVSNATATPTAGPSPASASIPTPDSSNDFRGSSCREEQLTCRDTACAGRQVRENQCGRCSCGDLKSSFERNDWPIVNIIFALSISLTFRKMLY